MSKIIADFDALARTLGAAAKAASEKRHEAALVFEAARKEFEALDLQATRAHRELVDLVGYERAGFYISR